MIKLKTYKNIFSIEQKNQWQTVLYVALFWTAIDLVLKLLSLFHDHEEYGWELLQRTILVFCMTLLLAWLFVIVLPNKFRNKSAIASFLIKCGIIMAAALAMNFIVTLLFDWLIHGDPIRQVMHKYVNQKLSLANLISRSVYLMALLLVTELIMAINDKFSPGVFKDIFTGKYRQPVVENRIVMFLDLKDSTPIAEQLGHEKYFIFIREFIRNVSEALIIHDATIYQYVGDEVVSSWPFSKQNVRQALATIITARRKIQENADYYRREFGFIPEFRVGLHTGDVTIGEIGLVKKELAMSGDTMNTTARIRSMANTLNHKFIISKTFKDHAGLKDFQTESLGLIEMKGKSEGVELFALKM